MYANAPNKRFTIHWRNRVKRGATKAYRHYELDATTRIYQVTERGGGENAYLRLMI